MLNIRPNIENLVRVVLDITAMSAGRDVIYEALYGSVLAHDVGLIEKVLGHAVLQEQQVIAEYIKEKILREVRHGNALDVQSDA